MKLRVQVFTIKIETNIPNCIFDSSDIQVILNEAFGKQTRCTVVTEVEGPHKSAIKVIK